MASIFYEITGRKFEEYDGEQLIPNTRMLNRGMHMRKLTAVLLGAGDRGAYAYGPYALDHPNEIEFVAVADSDKVRRNHFAKEHHIEESHCFEDWRDVLGQSKMADVIMICMQDQLHYEPAIAALNKGYHVLLEKPMSPNREECVEMTKVAEENKRLLTICHVMRYSPFWSAIKAHIERGDIGKVISIQLNENIGHLHMAHSYVRGNWRNSDLASPMILQKSCHDVDIISWLIDSDCKSINSYGALSLFKEENAPQGSTEYCLDGCEVADQCPYYAPDFYLSDVNWAQKVTNDLSREGIIAALKDGPYGKCVYHSDNNVVDHQVVNMAFEGGETAVFSMCGLTHDNTRVVQINGTKGEISGKWMTNQFTLSDFVTGDQKQVTVKVSNSGHGGSDSELMKHFVRQVHAFEATHEQGLTSARASLKSHLMAFTAEQSRLNDGQPVKIEEMYQ